MRGLIIRTPHIENILAGKKTWEMRSSRINFRERIALIKAGSGSVVGVADIVDCIGPLSVEQRIASTGKHWVPAAQWSDPVFEKYEYAWGLDHVFPLCIPGLVCPSQGCAGICDVGRADDKFDPGEAQATARESFRGTGGSLQCCNENRTGVRPVARSEARSPSGSTGGYWQRVLGAIRQGWHLFSPRSTPATCRHLYGRGKRVRSSVRPLRLCAGIFASHARCKMAATERSWQLGDCFSRALGETASPVMLWLWH